MALRYSIIRAICMCRRTSANIFTSISKNKFYITHQNYCIFPLMLTCTYSSESANTDSNSSNGLINYTVCKEDFKWVDRLLPPSKIPEPPRHTNYPTPSGWFPPADTVPDLPYFIRRTQYHGFPVSVQRKKSSLTHTHLDRIDGDIWELEKDLCKHLKPHMTFDPATTVHEMMRRITIKSDVKDLVIEFLAKNGF